MKRLRDWYAHPEYYDAIFDGDTDKEMAFLLELNRRYGTGGKLWLEPACGSGRLIAEGAQRGLRMVGYDISEEMLERARARMTAAQRRRARLYRARMEDFHPAGLEGKVDLAFNLVSTFRYLDSEEAALAHLEGTRRLLRPGGIYVLGFHLTDYRRVKPEHERWIGRLGRDRVVCNTHGWPPDRRKRVSRMRNRLRVVGPGKDWLIETSWSFRTYDERQVRALLKRAGLTLVERYDFDYRVDRPLPPRTDRLDWVMVLRGTDV